MTREERITLDGTAVRYTVRRSDRARRISMRVLPDRGLEVVLPRGVPVREAATFVRRERDWVLRALARVAARSSPDLTDGSPIPLLGGTLTLRLADGAGQRASARRDRDELRVTLAPAVPTAAVIEAWYRLEARRVIAARVALHAAALGVAPNRLAIKDTRTRWGSCSSKGNLNFSWRLILAPEAVMDYVVIHEVAHLREPNHSARFWDIVESVCPDYRWHRAWLRIYLRLANRW